MPSIEAVEQFKTIVQGLAREPEVRQKLGLPPEEILPPESQLDDDLADLLGSAPMGPGSGPDLGVDLGTDLPPEPEAAPEAEPVDTGLDDLFGTPVPDDVSGPNLDDLLGPAVADPLSFDEPEALEAEPATEPEADPLAGFDLGPDSAAEAPAADDVFGGLGDLSDLEALSNLDDLTADAPAAAPRPAAPEEASPFDDLGALDDAGLDALGDLDFSEPAEAPAAPAPKAPSRRAQEGVSPEDLDDDFFSTPGEDLFGLSKTPEPAAPAGPDFAPPDSDFPELAGFGDTKEEDVEAFDELGEADEFQLGDFESQFGITAEDHTDAELLNPAEEVELLDDEDLLEFALEDSDFKIVQQALSVLPLNVRLAVEELLGEKDLPADDIEKLVGLLLTRASPRAVASAAGKLLGKKIVVPPGFEKGTGADLEARHATLWYNLRTIMFPVLRVFVGLTVVAAVLVVLGWFFLYRPLRANDLYEKGLAEAQQNHGAQAETLFSEAWYYWPDKGRLKQYAETFTDTGDYDRARRKHLELLEPSVRAYRVEDKQILIDHFGTPLAPLPAGLNDQALEAKVAEKRQLLDEYYAYVTRLLSVDVGQEGAPGDIPGEVILGNPEPQAILDYSTFETNYGFDGVSKTAHFQRADSVLRPLLAENPSSKPGLLRKADNQLAWAQALSSKQALDAANAALSEYLRFYGYEAAVTWRFVRVFLLEDEAEELLKFRDRIDNDTRMAMDGETMALLARWLIDRHDAQTEEEKVVAVVPKTIEEEYGVRPTLVEPPTVEELAAQAAAVAADGEPAAAGSSTAAASHSLLRSEAAAAEGGSSSSEKAPPEIKPPYKYPNTSEPFRPDYLDKVDTLLLRAMDTQKSLPELHYQLSRFYRLSRNAEDERRALAAADTYFQRLAPRLMRLNERPSMRMATSLRIGEVFEAQGQPNQAEKYYLDALKFFESYQKQGLLSLNADAARLYRDLGNLYYRQAPGVEAAGTGRVPGAWEQAAQLYENAEGSQSEDPAVTYRLGVIHYERKDFDRAVKQFFTLDRVGNLGEASGRTNPNLLYSMGNALFRSGNYAAAEGYYRQLLEILREKRAAITEFDPVGRSAHRALATRLYETWNNLAAAEYRAANLFRAGTPEFTEALAALTTARAQSMTLGRDLYEDKAELDVTRADVEAIRADEAQIVAKTRKEKGLVEANLQVLALIAAAPPSRREALSQKLDIFARIPLELDQTAAP